MKITGKRRTTTASKADRLYDMIERATIGKPKKLLRFEWEGPLLNVKGQRIVYIDAAAMLKLMKGVTDAKRQEIRVECTTGKVQLKDKRTRPPGKKVRTDG